MYFDQFINSLSGYNENELILIKRALLFAKEKHHGQFRKSGEPYIIHPIAVASMLLEFKADAKTISAALLHDVLEDTDTTYADLEEEFGKEVAFLVDGVTKIKGDNHKTNEERKAQYIRKVTTSILSDVRIIIIKLMDRVHNMQTMEYQSHEKQIKISKETLEIYVPIAYYLGIYKIRFLLEDLSFKYLNPEKYQEIMNLREQFVVEGEVILNEMMEIVKEELAKYQIEATLEKSTKNIYGIYKRIKNGSNILDIGDLLRIKVIVSNLIECYQVLGIIHNLYHPINNRFKDYISSPKTNKYQSLHTTVYTNFNRLVQFQIRTREMNDIDVLGIINAWAKKDILLDITNYLFNNFPFVLVLKEINDNYSNDLEFLDKLEHDILKEKVYVIIGNGNILELPSGSTLKELGQKLGIVTSRIMVNNEERSLDYVLKSNDIISFAKNKVKRK